MSIYSQIDSLVAERSLLQHPFYLRWSKGDLTKEELSIYAKEYYFLVKNIPEIVSIVAKKIMDADLRASIEHNAFEEQEHVGLWERFAFSLGIRKEELDAYIPSNKVQDAVSHLKMLAEAGTSQGIAAIYALECELAEIARTKKEGLLQFYGLSSDDAHIYFDEHMKEEAHLQAWRAFTIEEAVALPAASQSLSLQHQVLDAVCQEAGIPFSC